MLSAHLQLTRSRQSRYSLRLPGPLPAQRPAPRNTSSLAISLSLFSSASSSLSAHQGNNTVPCSRNSGTKIVAETRVSISHHNCSLVHTYVQGNTTPWALAFQIWKKTEVANLKLSR